MKKILIAFLLNVSCFTTFAKEKPPIIEIAIKLKASLKIGKISVDNTVLSDIADLYPGTSADVIKALNENPFYKGQIEFTDATGRAAAVASRSVKDVQSIDVTNVANAVATLMIDRAKQELTIAFFNRLKTLAKKETEFAIIFPKTADNLSNLLSHSYPTMLPTLRNGFIDDLNQLPFSLEELLESPNYKSIFEQFPDMKIIIKILKLSHQLENGATPDKVLKDISEAAKEIQSSTTFDKNNIEFQNTVTALRLAEIMSESLRDPGETHIWITGDKVNNIVTSDTLFRIYVGLVWKQISNEKLVFYTKNSQVNTGTEVQTMLASNEFNLITFQQQISQLLHVTSMVEGTYMTIQRKAGTSPTSEEYHNYVASAIDAISGLIVVSKAIYPDIQACPYVIIARKTNDIYKDLYSSHYTQAINDGLSVMSNIGDMTTQKLNKRKVKQNDKAEIRMAIPENPEVLRALEEKRKKVENNNDELIRFVDKVKPYALFIANVADAKSSDDINDALNNSILPVGSSSIKKTSHNNFSIQTYLGAYYSIYNQQPNAIRSWTDVAGVYGPIGLAYTPGFLSMGKGGSISLFASIFDIGSIIDYQLKQDSSVVTSTNSKNSSTSTKQYKINLGQIFSPGIHVVYGMCYNVPLSIGIGAQYGPGLSSISAEGITNVINPCWRVNLFLGVDLPFFNLINKTKTKNY